MPKRIGSDRSYRAVALRDSMASMIVVKALSVQLQLHVRFAAYTTVVDSSLETHV